MSLNRIKRCDLISSKALSVCRWTFDAKLFYFISGEEEAARQHQSEMCLTSETKIFREIKKSENKHRAHNWA